MMRAFFAKMLVVITLFSFTPSKEMIKVPLLVMHYMEHISEMPEMSLSEFLDMHYRHGIVFDEDYEKDMQLPFKMIDFTPLPYFVFNEVKVLELRDIPKTFILENKLNSTYNFYPSDAKLAGIFHPPRV